MYVYMHAQQTVKCMYVCIRTYTYVYVPVHCKIGEKPIRVFNKGKSKAKSPCITFNVKADLRVELCTKLTKFKCPRARCQASRPVSCWPHTDPP